ncbi:BZ3500_MvSof-1268-A1-R1_Chr1-3g02484 [Microbotryum saponariae]|uniref:BZ3500_MvSof-1268-A1-R1_Chr1-3g02484 protein n=1 Tax=Microbotryum saponariae TaxID=289078 RepID=A0A2X0MVW4_9BASI|nr:BZ3500_MvSof-1268-A1-R1_Chr1-3g02484 [Microbotryum saponariae]SCZ96365.1 BZ3501_MvSof-1269-A2-R1_Chr1-3g02087 [Microbotryum saponariae]
MNSWKSVSASLQAAAAAAGATVQGAAQSVDLKHTGSSITRSFATLSQTVKERSGNADDITELPEEYLDLERRVDGLRYASSSIGADVVVVCLVRSSPLPLPRTAHINILRVAKAYEGPYDYPTQLQESVAEIGGSLAHNLTSWAAAATKGTNLPQPSVADKPTEVQKTLPHALSRAAASGAVQVGPGRLANILKTYAVTSDKIGNARTIQDEDIQKNFLHPWSATLNASLQAAMKSRASVKSARIQLDALRGTLKSATGGPSQEKARIEVEAAEEKLVNATEEAINLMRSVLDSPEPIKNLAALVKAQQAFYAEAAEVRAQAGWITTFESIQGEMEEASVQAEAEYRKSRAQ